MQGQNLLLIYQLINCVMNKSKVSIVIADDHPIMLNGLGVELRQANYNVVGTAENGAKALELIASLQPMIAILDIEMPLLNGYEVVKRGKLVSPNTGYIIMTYHKEKGFITQAKKLGIFGYLLKEDGINAIETCIKAVLNDESYYSKSFALDVELVVENELRKIQLLTPSERTIIRLVAQQKTSAQIAEQLLISLRTVQKHRSNIISKLEIQQNADALSHWIREHQELIASL